MLCANGDGLRDPGSAARHTTCPAPPATPTLAQLDQMANTDLVARIDELTEAAQRLTAERDAARAENATLLRQVETLEDDLAAARTSLRRMIRTENLPPQ